MTMLQRFTAVYHRFFSGKKAVWRVAVLGVVALIGFVVPNMTHAAGQCGLSDPPACAAMIFVWIFQILTALMGHILILEVDALIKVAQFVNFVSPGPTAVRIGWIVTRDLANMFFIVFLLIIAFSTVIGYAKYHYEKTLSTLLVMAVVINFSKTICGLLIDASQVIMLSFVNGFKAAAAGNFLNAFQISKLLQLGEGQQDYSFGLVLAMMLAFIMAATAACVMLIMLIIMVFRVVMLWILIILSPIAFLTRAFPFESNYYGEWWGELKKYLIGGPVIAFFLWLALVTAQQTSGNLSSEGFGASSAGSQAETSAQEAQLGANNARIPSEAGRTETLLSMVITVCILFAGLKYASDPKFAGAAGGLAKKVRGKFQDTLKGAAYGGAKWAAGPALGLAGRGVSKIPLVGGLGRAAVLTSEKWKKDRQAGLEKRFGSLDDMARLSPSAFRASLKDLAGKRNLDKIDKDRLNSMMGIALKDPKMAQALGEDGAGVDALNSLVRSSSGKGLQDAVGIAMSDKNANSWAKKDPSFTRSMYDKLMKETYETDKDGELVMENGKPVVKDPNMKKTLDEFKQKFAPQLAAMPKDINLDPNINPNADPDIAKKAEKILSPDELKNLVPKMSSDDIAGIAKGDIGTFMPHMTSGQLRKLAQDGTLDQHTGMLEALSSMPEEADRKEILAKFGTGDIPASWFSDDLGKPGSFVSAEVLERTKGDAKERAALLARDKEGKLKAYAQKNWENVQKSGTTRDIAMALPDVVSLGVLSAGDIQSNAKVQAAIKEHAGQVDIRSMGRMVSETDAERSSAARAIADIVGEAKPDKIQELRKGGMLSHVLPSAADMESRKTQARATQSAELNKEADATLTALKEQVRAIEVSGGSTPSALASAEKTKLDEAARGLETTIAQQKQAVEERQKLKDRIAEHESGKVNLGEAQIKGLRDAEKTFEKRVEQLNTAVAKAVAEAKGVKFDTGEKNNDKRRNRGRGGGGSV